MDSYYPHHIFNIFSLDTHPDFETVNFYSSQSMRLGDPPLHQDREIPRMWTKYKQPYVEEVKDKGKEAKAIFTETSEWLLGPLDEKRRSRSPSLIRCVGNFPSRISTQVEVETISTSSTLSSSTSTSKSSLKFVSAGAPKIKSLLGNGRRLPAKLERYSFRFQQKEGSQLKEHLVKASGNVPAETDFDRYLISRRAAMQTAESTGTKSSSFETDSQKSKTLTKTFNFNKALVLYQILGVILCSQNPWQTAWENTVILVENALKKAGSLEKAVRNMYRRVKLKKGPEQTEDVGLTSSTDIISQPETDSFSDAESDDFDGAYFLDENCNPVQFHMKHDHV